MPPAPTEDFAHHGFPQNNVYLHVYYHPSKFVGVVANNPVCIQIHGFKTELHNCFSFYQLFLLHITHFKSYVFNPQHKKENFPFTSLSENLKESRLYTFMPNFVCIQKLHRTIKFPTQQPVFVSCMYSRELYPLKKYLKSFDY